MAEQQTERQKRIAARQERLRSRLQPPPAVRVEPANDDLRRVLRHPRGLGFAETGSIEWPLDRFTKRRIADGSITVAADSPRQERHQAAHSFERPKD
jgi:hypothetical protein